MKSYLIEYIDGSQSRIQSKKSYSYDSTFLYFYTINKHDIMRPSTWEYEVYTSVRLDKVKSITEVVPFTI